MSTHRQGTVALVVNVREPSKETGVLREGQASATAGEPALRQLIREALGAVGADRPVFAGRLNAALRALPQHQEPRAVAGLLTRALETSPLGELVDEGGLCCRATAVEVLLSLGYPFALEVSPEDLEFLRAQAPKRTSALRLILGTYLIYPFAAVEFSFSSTDFSHLFTWLQPAMLLHLAATVGALQGVVRTKPGSAARAWSVWLLALCGGFGLGLAGGGLLPAAFTGLVTFATCLLWRRDERAVTPRG